MERTQVEKTVERKLNTVIFFLKCLECQEFYTQEKKGAGSVKTETDLSSCVRQPFLIKGDKK